MDTRMNNAVNKRGNAKATRRLFDASGKSYDFPSGTVAPVAVYRLWFSVGERAAAMNALDTMLNELIGKNFSNLVRVRFSTEPAIKELTVETIGYLTKNKQTNFAITEYLKGLIKKMDPEYWGYALGEQTNWARDFRRKE